MPTVTVNGKKMEFPYTATGKPKADYFARLHGGKKKDNPGYGDGKKILLMGELKKWREQKWVRIGTDGSILGACGTSKNKKNPDRCLCL